MRQAGILRRPALSHLNIRPDAFTKITRIARRLAFGVANLPGVAIDPDTVVTNIVIFNIARYRQKGGEICEQLKELGGSRDRLRKSIRMVTHCDVSSADVEAT